MKSVLISIRPKWIEKIANGEKTIEVRKTTPQEVPFKAYVYCMKRKPFLGFHTEYVDGTPKKIYTDHLFGSIPYFNGKVIGEFICDKVILLHPYTYDGGSADLGHRKFIQTFEGSSKENEILEATCLTQDEMFDYIGTENYGYGWNISNLKIYDKPKELSEFCIPCKTNCEDCKNPLFYDCWLEKGRVKVVTRPPQGWCYVETSEVEE